jgi:hypothetical protein
MAISKDLEPLIFKKNLLSHILLALMKIRAYGSKALQ